MKTFELHIAEQSESTRPNARGQLHSLLSEIVAACATISERVRRLDVFANQLLIERVGTVGRVGLIVSEEEEKPVVLADDPTDGDYLVVFDPLDGSSNLDAHVSVGTIFSVYSRVRAQTASMDAQLLQRGANQLMAGYVLYGASTVLVYTTGNGVHGFTLDPVIGTFVLSYPNIQMPKQGGIYSVNDSLATAFPEYCRRFLDCLKSRTNGSAYRSRYIGSLVADFHRTLLKGGVFLYPPTSCHRDGKLRLLYEANPIAYLAQQAGGMATNGAVRILDVVPTSLHQRVPLFVGGSFEMNLLAEFVQEPLHV